jgi:hypothetical protein
MPAAKDVIGTLSQKWDEDNQRVNGEFWFHEEKIPDTIKEKIVNRQPVAISPGFMVDGIEDGVQKGIVYTHVAVLDEEDPRCPLGECGVNLRMDSKEEHLIRYDQKSEVPPEPEKTSEPEPVEAEQEPPEEQEPPQEIEETTEEPAEQKPEVQEQEPEQVQREPEVILPVSQPATEELPEGIRMVDGAYEWVPKAYRQREDE